MASRLPVIVFKMLFFAHLLIDRKGKKVLGKKRNRTITQKCNCLCIVRLWFYTFLTWENKNLFPVI